MRRSPVLLALLVALATAATAAGCAAARPPGPDSTDPPGGAVVESVTDGDTIEVSVHGRTERVRLLGIDTPESVDPNRPVECFGPEASAFTAEVLPVGTAITLERDEEARDHFGRLLAYVFRTADGLFVNEALVAGGYAETLFIEPNAAHTDRLAEAEAGARAAGAGLWGTCTDP